MQSISEKWVHQSWLDLVKLSKNKFSRQTAVCLDNCDCVLKRQQEVIHYDNTR